MKKKERKTEKRQEGKHGKIWPEKWSKQKLDARKKESTSQVIKKRRKTAKREKKQKNQKKGKKTKKTKGRNRFNLA